MNRLQEIKKKSTEEIFKPAKHDKDQEDDGRREDIMGIPCQTRKRWQRSARGVRGRGGGHEENTRIGHDKASHLLLSNNIHRSPKGGGSAYIGRVAAVGFEPIPTSSCSCCCCCSNSLLSRWPMANKT